MNRRLVHWSLGIATTAVAIGVCFAGISVLTPSVTASHSPAVPAREVHERHVVAPPPPLNGETSVAPVVLPGLAVAPPPAAPDVPPARTSVLPVAGGIPQLGVGQRLRGWSGYTPGARRGQGPRLVANGAWKAPANTPRRRTATGPALAPQLAMHAVTNYKPRSRRIVPNNPIEKGPSDYRLRLVRQKAYAKTRYRATAVAHNHRGQIAASWAVRQLGKPYHWGATGPASFDCSGLSLRAWQAAGIALPRVAAQQYGAGKHLPVRDAGPGDLVFYATDPSKPSTIDHVGLAVGHGRMVEAPVTGAVVRIDTIGGRGLVPLATRPG